MITREEVIEAAKECDAYRYINRAAKDEPTHTFTIEKLERFYNSAFEAGAESRNVEIAELLAALLKVARMAEDLKLPCGMEPENSQAIRNGKYMHISYVARAAIAKVKEPNEHA